MGKRFFFGLGLLVLCVLGAPNPSWAQCSWCTTVTDACCDSDGTTANFSIPCATSAIYVQFDIATTNRVRVLIHNLDTEDTLFDDYVICDCFNGQLWNSGMSLPAGTNLFLKVTCMACEESCSFGNASVKFYTPSTNGCSSNCPGS